MTTTLESNFEIIFKHLTVDEIFLWTYNRNGVPLTITQVHTHNKQCSRTLRERCERALLPMEGYTFTFYNTKDVQARINDGLGRLHLSCQPEHRIYVNPKPINTVILPDLSIEQLLEQTREEGQVLLSKNLGYSKYLWSRRCQNANHLIGPWSGEASQFETLVETCSYMLVLAIEQICLGLTKQFFDYAPSSTNLNYLLDLCDVICPEVTFDFQRDRAEQKTIFNQLIRAQQKFRHSTTYEAKGKYLPELYQLTKSFIQKANDFVEAYFEQQKEIEEANKTENIEQCA